MAALSEVLRILIDSNSAGAQADMKKLGLTASDTMTKLEKLKSAAMVGAGIGVGAEAVGGVINGLQRAAQFGIAQGRAAINQASQLQQAQATVNAVFEDSVVTLNAFAETAATKLGLSKAAFFQNTAAVGSLLQNLGYTQDAAAQTSKDLVTIAADLGAAFGRSTEDAMQGLTALLRGEFDTIEKFGIKIKEVDIQARAQAMGLDMSTVAAKNNATAIAALALATEQAAKFQGTFADRSGTLLGQQQRLNAEVANLRAELGAALLPAMTALVGVARDGVKNLAVLADNVRFVREQAQGALGPIDDLVDGLARLPKLEIPSLRREAEGAEDLNAQMKVLQQTLQRMGVDADVAFEKLSADQFRAVGAAFERSGLSAREFIASIADERLGSVPPMLADIVSRLLELQPAAQTAAEKLDDLLKETRGLSDTIFGTGNAESAFFKSLEAGTSSAGRSAKQLEKAYRSIDGATRSLADAQGELQEAEIARFLTSLGATSDEITEAQIGEREATRSLTQSKRELAKALSDLTAMREVDRAGVMDAEAAYIQAQRDVVEAERSRDAVAMLRANAELIRSRKAFNEALDPTTSDEYSMAQERVGAAQDGVLQAEIDLRKAREQLVEVTNRGKEGSDELADANKRVEQAQRRVEDAEYALVDANDALTGSTSGLAASTKDAGDQFRIAQGKANEWLLDLIDKKKTPEEFAGAIKTIRDRLGEVASQAGQTDELDAYLTKIQELRDKILAVDKAASGASIRVAGILPPGFVGSSGGIGASTGVQNIELKIDGKTFGSVVVNSLINWAADNGALPIRVR